MQTVGYSERTDSRPSPSLLERLSWVDKLPIAILSGLILGLSSAPFGIWWLAWFALAPLFLLVFGARSKGEAALTGLVYGLAYHMLALRWMLDLHPMRWFVANDFMSGVVAFQLWFLESLHQSLLFCLFALFIFILPTRAGFTPHYKRPFYPVHLTVPIVWLFTQWFLATSPLFLGVPIDQLAYGQSRFPAVIQVARFGGAQLVDFLIVLFNSVLACWIIEVVGICPRFESRTDVFSDRVGAYSDLGFVGALLALVLSWGQQEVRDAAALPQGGQSPSISADALPPQGAAATGAASTKVATATANATLRANYAPPIPLAVVQGNMSVQEAKDASATQIASRYMDLSKDLGVGLIVLPAGVINTEKRGMESLSTALVRLAKDQRKDVIAGVRLVNDFGIADSVRLFSPLSPKPQVYDKFRLLPFAEYTPLGPFGALLSGGLSDKLGGGKTHVTAGYLSTLQSVWGRVGVSVGPELVYPDLILHEVNRGASLLVNVSDLSYFHNSVLGQELVAAASLRAVENGRYFVVASNTAGSAVIDPRGIVTSSSLIGQQGVLFDRVQFLHRRTPFTRMCLWTPLYR